ncbi:MAG: DUF433 domain-containing protein [Pseudonocardiaceae bacterium]
MALVPFIAVIEAYVLRSLRDLGLSKKKIREAAAAVRRDFKTAYGLATRRIATDGIDIFISYADDELLRAYDGQAPIREIIDAHLRYITWDGVDGSPTRLTLQQYPEVAPVVIDPRFGWGAPVITTNNVQVDMVVQLWRSGESLDAVAQEYGITRDVAEAICRIVYEGGRIVKTWP